MAERDENLIKNLTGAGIAQPVIAAALDIDGVLQRWRRRVVKRELGQRALADLGLELDLAQLDALMAVRAPRNEFDDTPCGETMVSTVADRLGIDPSRASRLTGELIRLGLVRRAVSQRDGRRSVLKTTDAGEQVVQAVRLYKFMALGDFLSEWTPQEIQQFLPLFERFSAWSDRTEHLPDHLKDRVSDLAASLPTIPVERDD
ncbi:MarR family winged helix-turn-helix transcriptional regulator [Nioella nitratireducens]|uniref:MarR family winged helix-turn-helix transcriptional regulator n=1 Tax=Nioella nitratireducens TaxID=1287720 RepID=UPI0008FD08F4|nr:MarR family transcriptional regulator [Nioella nitratireducens]